MAKVEKPLQIPTTLKVGKSIINIKSVKILKSLFWVLSNPMKMKIIRTINAAGEKGIFVKDIQEKIELNQSHTSIHLRELRKVKLVSSHRDGRFVMYKINAATFHDIEAVIDFAQKMNFTDKK